MQTGATLYFTVRLLTRLERSHARAFAACVVLSGCTLLSACAGTLRLAHDAKPSDSAAVRLADPYVNAHPALANADCGRAEMIQP